MARVVKEPTAPYNPVYGCVIMSAAVLVFAGIVSWSLYSLFSQDRQIEAFTVDAPASLTGNEFPKDQEAALLQKVEAFADAKEPGTRLELNVAEINGLIALAPDTGNGTYKDMIRIQRTEPAQKALIASLSLPLNRLKFWEGKKRYLVGEGTLQLETDAENGIEARMIDVRVPGKALPEGFIKGMQVWPFVAPYRNNDKFGPVLKRIGKVEVTPQGIVLEATK